MIPRQNIIAWSKRAPWAEQRQIEQDLIISRALVEIWGPGAPADGSAAWSARLAADQKDAAVGDLVLFADGIGSLPPAGQPQRRRHQLTAGVGFGQDRGRIVHAHPPVGA